MAGMKLAELEFLRLLPSFMRDDEAAIALSKAVDELIGEPSQRIPSIRTWDQIDNLSEAECDEMAWEQDVDWYDSTGMSLEEKRATIKLAQQIKRKRGTKWAVERLITAYFGEGYVVEWYDMDDSPYTFVALTTNTAITPEGYAKFVEAVRSAKNERSHIAGVFYFWPQGPDPGIEYAMGYQSHKYEFRKAGTYPQAATVGALMKPSVETEPEASFYRYGYEKAGDLTCGTYPQPGTIGAAVRGEIDAEGEAAAYAYGFERQAGTYPRAGTVGALENNKAATAPAIAFAAYGFTKCGTRRCGE